MQLRASILAKPPQANFVRTYITTPLLASRLVHCLFVQLCEVHENRDLV